MAWYDLKEKTAMAMEGKDTAKESLMNSLHRDMKILVRRQEDSNKRITELFKRIEDILDHLNLEYRFTPSKTELVKRKKK